MQIIASHIVKLSAYIKLLLALFITLVSPTLFAHGVAEGDKGYIQEIYGVHVIPFIYLGAKHMVTGYDHLLFLVGIIFFLYRMKDIGLYVSLFALGHSITMLVGVYYNISINAYIIDAIIGFSIVYKALDNLGAYQRWFGFQPNTKVATLIFGLIHGFGFAGLLQEAAVPTGLLPWALAGFNGGIEIGQLLVVSLWVLVSQALVRWSGYDRVVVRGGSVALALLASGWFLQRVTG